MEAPPCAACAAGPSGSDGHGELLVQRIGDGHLSFRCVRCEALWHRAGDAEGGFTWTTLGERAAMSPAMGVAVPPRSSAFHPFREFPGRTASPQWGAISGRSRSVSRRTTS